MKWQIVIKELPEFPGKVCWTIERPLMYGEVDMLAYGREDDYQLACDAAKNKLDRLLAKQH